MYEMHEMSIPNGGSPSRGGRVVYYLTDTTCVFSGVKGPTSTINAAEEIIEEICRQEGRVPQNLTFFDLQTSFGYSSKKPGQYEFDELSFRTVDGKVEIVSWSRRPCPDEVLQQFRSYLGSSPEPLQ